MCVCVCGLRERAQVEERFSQLLSHVRRKGNVMEFHRDCLKVLELRFDGFHSRIDVKSLGKFVSFVNPLSGTKCLFESL